MTQTSNNPFSYNLTQDYLEVARGALTPIHGKVPENSDESNIEPSGELANAIFAVVSISIVYSFLALESFLNYQLYRLWNRRDDNSPESNRFLDELGNVTKFEMLKNNDNIRELPERLKTICRLYGYPMPHNEISKTWQNLNDLVKVSRHFIIHPYPDPEYFNKNMDRILTKTEGGMYVNTVVEIITYLYEKGSKIIPEWVKENQLIEFRGVDLIPIQSG